MPRQHITCKHPLMFLVLLMLALPVICLAMGDTPPAEIRAKPSAPLAIEITEAAPVANMPGGSIALSVTVRSHGPAGQVRVSLRLIGGATLIEGDESWSGSIGPGGGSLSRSIVVQGPVYGGGGAIVAEASIKDAHSGVFKAHARFRMGKTDESRKPAAGRTGRDSSGREIEEFPAR